jgi:hypothetical protein
MSYHRAPETIARMTAAQRRRREIEYHERLVRKLGIAAREPDNLDGRVLIVCRCTQEEAIASAQALEIDLTLYGVKLGTIWFSAPIEQKLNVLVWSLAPGSPVIFHGGI